MSGRFSIMHELNRVMDFPAAQDEMRADLEALYEVEVESDGKPAYCGGVSARWGLFRVLRHRIPGGSAL